MSRYTVVEKLLKGYRLNGARILFIESRIKRLAFNEEPERMGVSDGEVHETEEEYGRELRMKMSLQKELKSLRIVQEVTEDALNTLEQVDKRYKAIINDYYIEGCRMEDIAERMHISRSKCYELCREAAEMLSKVLAGEGEVYI
ncbi:hypothetical protein DFR58_11876 [Anaerobacterium chartisolvens]|uniref:RNA polymerase sigma factor (Sigma-70 family) n=1 Tax=Anaerobacterium chartisolvens TaxID=1297424 RepID=A0A369AY56_9FIRM|nr:hypothetical protein [Anaerobacterium chartisolvens]RCX13258.1 hypothetical protein DFR58_11876 [Anaerobacterium chartisolvens]